MPKLEKSLPRLRSHKPSGQFCVYLDGHRIYLGKTKRVAKQQYDTLIAEWLANGRKLPGNESAAVTVNEVILAYMKHANGYYVKHGEVTREYELIREVLSIVRKMYGRTSAEEFGPKRFQAVRHVMIDAGKVREQINKAMGRVIRAFKWSAAQEQLPASVYQNLQAVDGLRIGRTKAKEGGKVLPATEAQIAATLPHLPPIVADMVRFQRLVGCRPGEVCDLRPCDIDRSADVWEYRPWRHKTEHQGKDRVIYIGPRAQEIVANYLNRDAEAFCFSPAEAEHQRRAAEHAQRKTPASCGNSIGSNRVESPRRRPGVQYNKDSYAKAVKRACEKAFPAPEGLAPAANETNAACNRRLEAEGRIDELKNWRKEKDWSPNRLRHSRASEVRREFGLEGAQVTLGHSNAQVTEVYAERDAELARQVARQTG